MKLLWIASRPKTLILSLLPPVVSYAYARVYFSSNEWRLAVCATFSSLCIQLATNYFNDLIDFEKGADLERVGPLRVVASGLVSPQKIRRWAITAIVFALLFGIPLIYSGGWVIGALGLVSLYLTYGYTGGRSSIAYRGLGELFVFLFFGVFSFVGSFFIYTHQIDSRSVVFGCIYGLLSTTFIAINNLRDRTQDAKVKKMTLATKLSEPLYRFFVFSTVVIPHILIFILCKGPALSNLALIPAIALILTIFRAEGPSLNSGLKTAGIHILLFSIGLGLDIHYENLR